VLVTHLHPDHVGCAGWLSREHDIELWMTREEYLLCRVLVADTGQPAPAEGIRFYESAGFTGDAMARYRETFGMFGRVVSPLPQSHQRLGEGQVIRIGEDSWRVIVGRGHSPEHACLYCESRNILISGDQILPTISSNVSVYPREPLANPLADWFESLQRLKRELDEEVLVLPSHGRPFRGAHIRLDELIDEHEDGLQKLRRLCRQPQRAVDVFPALFKSRITEKNLIMAAGEAIAHLNYLVQAGEMTCEQGHGGVKSYQMAR
jgi:glyoxylase-like metal-dependent hydrolase (beta-lactamase superfamily II)